MSDRDEDDAPKSALELALAKLKARGGYEPAALTDEQKAEIAEIRTRTKAKIAEIEIGEQGKIQPLLAAGAFEEAEALRAALAREKEKLQQEAEDLVQKVRAQKA